MTMTIANTVEPPITDSPRSDQPLNNGQKQIPQTNLVSNTHNNNFRKATTSEFSRTDSGGIPCSNVQQKLTSENGQRPHPTINQLIIFFY